MMFIVMLSGLCNAMKSGLIAAAVWTCGLSGVLWFFSKPAIPFFNFVAVLAPYSIAFFGAAALVFELLTQWVEKDSMGLEHK